MTDLLDRFQQLERRISKERGSFYLFALFLREDAPDVWDLVVAAPWLKTDSKEAFDYIARQLQDTFAPGELTRLSRIAIIDQNNASLHAITSAIHSEHGRVEAQNSSFFGIPIKHAYIVTANMPKVASPTAAA